MAYISSITETASATAATYQATVPAHSANDLLLICLTQDGGATDISPNAAAVTAGWQMIGNQLASGGSKQAWAYLLDSAGTATSPTFAGSNDEWRATCYVVKDADTTTPINCWQRIDFNNVNTISSNAVAASSAGGTTVITPSDYALAFISWGSDGGSTTFIRHKLSDCVANSKLQLLDSSLAVTGIQVVAHRQLGASAAMPAMTMYSSIATEGGNGWVICIKNKAGGALQPYPIVTANELNWHGSFGAQHQSAGGGTFGAYEAASNFAATLNGINTSAALGAGVTTTGFMTTNVWGSATTAPNADNATVMAGVTQTIPSTDMTGLIANIVWSTNFISASARVGSEGVLLGLLSSVGNYVLYRLKSKAAGWSSGVDYSSFVAVDAAETYIAEVGTFDPSAVTRIGLFWHRTATDTTSQALLFKNFTLFTGTQITGGGAAYPATFAKMVGPMQGWDHYKSLDLQGSSQVLGKISTQIGNAGTIPVYFDGGASSFEYPLPFSSTQFEWNVNASQVALSVYAGGSSDTINLAAGVAATTLEQGLTINASSSTSGNYSVAGQSFVGWTPTWKTGIPCSSATFKYCGMVDFKGADIVNVIANNGIGTALISASDGFSATGCAFTASSTAVYGIRIAAAGTFSLDGTTFSGFTKDIDVTDSNGAHTVTINLAAGQSTPTYQTAGATVDIVSSPVFQSVVINNLVAGSRVQIYDTTSSAQLFNDIVAGTSKTWTDGAPASAGRAIRVRIANVSGATAYEFLEASIGTCGVTSGTETVTYRANQVADTTYNSNAVDGSAVTGITIVEGATDRVQISIAGGSVSWASIYAYQCYWLFDATGITDDGAFIEAPDTANYILTGFKIKNTHASIPLLITGGYGVDSTGSVSALYDTTGTSIFPAPAHVVPYATGSGVTPSDVTDIAAASATASAAAIVSAAVDGTTTLAESLRLANAVLGGKVSGAGSTAETFRNLADTKDRMVFTVDSSGNRTAVTRDLT